MRQHIWIDRDGLVVIGHGSLVVRFPRKSNASVGKGACVIWVEPNCFVAVSDGFVVLAYALIGEASFTKGVGVPRIESEWLCCSQR